VTDEHDVADPAELARRVAEIHWWHTIDLGHGVVTPGRDDTLRKLADVRMPADLSGKSVLDIGAWDGAFSFEAERRGAERVVAVDYYTWREGWHLGFDLAHEALGSKVEAITAPFETLDPDTLGTFDVVLYLGVLYHARDPFMALRRCADLTRDLLIVETAVDMLDVRRPAMAFYEGEVDGDPTTWFGPNVAACEAMLRAAGFSSTEVVLAPPSRAQRLLRSVRTRRFGQKHGYRAIVHARK
jgi:tRNA (mo5U34)-methyltransferase